MAVSVAVRARAEAVWSELSEIADHVTWMRDAVAIRFLGAQRRGIGTAFACDTRIGPFRVTDVMEVTEWEPRAVIAVRHVGRVGGDGRFSLEAGIGDGDGTTTVRWVERLALPWWLGGRLGGRAARPLLRAVWAGNLQRLRRRVEERARGPVVG